MEGQFQEEKKHLKEIKTKLTEALSELDNSIIGYEKEFRDSMKYLWESRSDMDSMEIFSNEKSISQIVNSGEHTVRRRDILEKLLDSPYFARIDFVFKEDCEGGAPEPFYIGRFTFTDEKGELLIYDWRAPVSSMYYDFELGKAFYQAPMGRIAGELSLKRQFKIKKGVMEYALESSVSIGDEVLQRELSHTSDQKMKNIVATIQKEQNKIIRNEEAEILIIQGVAGSGKTSIALHRVAYFLYKYKDQLSALNIMIISPNKVFADYISNVLPELGEEPIVERDFDDLASEIIGDSIKFESYGRQMETLLKEEDPLFAARVRYKSSMEFLTQINAYIEKFKGNWKRKEKDVLNLYQAFFQQINQPDMFVYDDKRGLETADVYPYIYLKSFCNGIQSFGEIRHLVIDEMQDYTPIQYATLEKLFKCKKTILGDFGQNVHPQSSASKEIFLYLYDKMEFIELTKSYRSTYEIIDFAKKIKDDKIEAIERHGERPRIISCKGHREEIVEIGTLVDSFQNSGLSSAGILCKSREAAEKLFNELNKKYKVSLLDFNSTKFQEGVIITTLYMAKGLEFDEVIIPRANAETYLSEWDRGLLYIGVTRAMHKLSLTYSGTITKLIS